MNFAKRLSFFALPSLLLALSLASCMRNDAGTTGPETVTLRESSETAETRLAFLTKEMGIPADQISVYVDEVSRESSYVATPSIPAATLKAAKARKQSLRPAAMAFKFEAIDAMIARSQEASVNKAPEGQSILSSLTNSITGKNPGLAVASQASGKNLGKKAHTRWLHWTSLLDVKALTEVRLVKVFIKSEGSDRLGPNWQTGVRNAIANWSSQARGTAISYEETNDINAADIIVRGAYGLGSTGTMSYMIWINSGPYVERIPSYGGTGDKSTDIVLNIGYEHNGVPISEKTRIAMAALVNIFNIGWIDTEGWYWNFGDYTYIPGTVQYDGDANTPGSSILTNLTSPVSTPVMTAGDLHLFRTLYPIHAITAKLNNNALTVVGYEGFTTVATNVKDFHTEGDTIVYSTYDGKLFRRIGLNGSNTQVWPASGSSGSVVSFLHSGGYLAVTTNAGRIYTRKPTGGWSMQLGDGAASSVIVRLDGERFFARAGGTSQSYLSLKYLSSAPNGWSPQWTGSVPDFQVLNGVLAVVDYGNIWVKKDGSYNWVMIHAASTNGPAQKLYLTDNLIGFYHVPNGSSTGRAAIAIGGAFGPIHYIPDPMYSAEDMDLCGDKLAFLQQSAYLRVVDYSTYLVHEHYNLPGHLFNSKVRLGGGNCDYVTIVDHSQNLWAKYGATLQTTYFPYQTGVAALSQRQ